MRRFQVVLLASMLVSLSGCGGVVSLHPLAMPNDKEAIFDPALVGTWEEVRVDKDGSKARYVVDRAESGYTVNPGPSGGVALPVHLFFKVRMEKDSAWLAKMQSNWFKEQIKTRAQLGHEVLMEEDDRIVLTASSSELRRHLLPYVADDRSFDGENELRRIK